MDLPAVTPEMLKQLSTPQNNLSSYSSCLCGKQLNVTESTRPWYSGIVNYPELMCLECRVEFENMPRIVCVGCKSLMGFMTPGRQKTGFVFERMRHYHIADCPKCNSAAVSTPILEHERFCRDGRIPTRRNLDLVEEIQQKHLNASKEADNLRSEFEKDSHRNDH